MAGPLIEFKNVTKGFGSRTILEHVNLKIYEGEVTTLIGKSGAGKRYLKLTMELEIKGEEKRLEVERRIPHLRDTILLLLSSRSLKDIGTMEGKLELKQALLLRINRILGEGIVHKLYFTEFVVQ